MRVPVRAVVARATLIVVSLGLVFTSQPSVASSLKAQWVVRKHVVALGGKKRKAVKAIRAVGHVEVRGMTIPFTAWRQRPDLSRLEISIMGYEVIQAYDGKTAWWVNPIVGALKAEEMPSEYAREVVRWTDFDGPLVDYRKKRHKIKYLGRERLDTGEAHKLSVRLAYGDEWQVYIDSKTYLEVKRSYTHIYEGQTSTVDTYFSNFIDIDGLVAPGVIQGVGLGGEPFTMKFETVDTDVDVDTNRFQMPGRKKYGFGLLK